MTRAYHSPSSVALGRRCERAWAYTYIDGLREPDVPWGDIEAGRIVPSRMRSLSLGKATHAVGEEHFDDGPDEPQWATLPGQIYVSGIDFLPRPSACETIEVERAIGDVEIPATRPGAPTQAMLAHGIHWAGFRDLAVCVDGAWTQIDYKTTSSIRRWAHTTETLHEDLQCAIYTLDLARRLGLNEINSRWLYLETKKVRRAQPVDVTMSRAHAFELIAPAAELAKHLDTIESSASAEANMGACWDYGGCRFHRRNGGPCDAKMSVSAYFRREKEIKDMPDRPNVPQDLAAKFGAIPPPAPPAPPAEPPAPTEPAPPPVETPVAEPEPEPKPKRARKPKAAPEPLPTPSPSPAAEPGALSEQLAVAFDRFAAAEAEYADALAAIRTLVGGA